MGSLSMPVSHLIHFVFSHHRKIQWGKTFQEDILIFLYNTLLNYESSLSILTKRKYNFKVKLSLDSVKLNSKEKMVLGFIALRWEAGRWGIDTSQSSVINLQFMVVFPGDVPITREASRRLSRAACLLWEVQIYQDPESGSEKAVISRL